MVLAAQVDEALEQWAEEMESTVQAEAYADEIMELRERHLNINDTTALDMIPFLSPFSTGNCCRTKSYISSPDSTARQWRCSKD